MSKERELLEEIISGDEVGDFYLTENMFIKIRELLAQPEQTEQTEQEPVEDRIARWHKLGFEQGKKASQREPLSDQEIYDLDDEVNGYVGKNTVRAVMRWIRKVEKAHGIGLDD